MTEPRNPWLMLGYHADYRDLEEVAWEVASMVASAPTPYKWDRDQLEDANGNSVIVADVIPAINAAPALLLQVRKLAEQLRQAYLELAALRSANEGLRGKLEIAEEALRFIGQLLHDDKGLIACEDGGFEARRALERMENPRQGRGLALQESEGQLGSGAPGASSAGGA